MTEEEQSKRDWEPKPGDTVYTAHSGFRPTFLKQTVSRVTATQIIVESAHGHVEPERYRRQSGWSDGRDYPSFSQVGGRNHYRKGLYHPRSQAVLNALAEGARQGRLNAVLKAQEAFVYHRDAETAQKAVEALQDFIQHEEDASKG